MANTFDAFIDRTGAETLVPTPISGEIFSGIAQQSAVLSMARRLPNMTSKMLKLPVLNSLPSAYFVDGDDGLKQTTSVEWTGKNITAEEIAVIVPVPDAVLQDSEFDVWAQIQPLIAQAFGKKIDQAILYGTDKPDSWPDGILTSAETAQATLSATGDGYQDIMGTGGLIDLVEKSGYMVTGYVGAMTSRAYLRGIRAEDGMPIFRGGMNTASAYMLDGAPIEFPTNGAVDDTKSLLIAGDWKQLCYAIRQDLTVTKSNQAVITDAAGKVIQNFYQQDMTALRFVMRLGWQLPNPVGGLGGSTRYPFAVLKPAASALSGGGD